MAIDVIINNKIFCWFRQIRKLLYEDGFTIEGARTNYLATPEPVSQSVKANAMVKKVIADLETVLQNLQAECTIVVIEIESYANSDSLLMERSIIRGVAQPGSALVWGASGRRFKSGRPDNYSWKYMT